MQIYQNQATQNMNISNDDSHNMIVMIVLWKADDNQQNIAILRKVNGEMSRTTIKLMCDQTNV